MCVKNEQKIINSENQCIHKYDFDISKNVLDLEKYKLNNGHSYFLYYDYNKVIVLKNL